MAGGAISPAQPPPAKRRNKSVPTTATDSLGEDLPPAAMAGGSEGRRRRRPRKARRDPPIHKLGDDLVLEVFLRLPSLATLVRAAFACRAWRRAVASSSAFRRRFRALHPPPLLGFFFDAPDAAEATYVPAFPAFVPIRPRDGDLAAAVRGGDFFLTSLQAIAGESPCWEIVDCRRGYALLMNWGDSLLVAMNPLQRRSESVFDFGSPITFKGYRGDVTAHGEPRLLRSDDEPTAFRSVLLAHDKSRIRATVFSSGTRKWSIRPWVKVPAPVRSEGVARWVQTEGMQANGFLFWVYEDQRYLISLNTATMKFSTTELPQCLRNSSYDASETKDGEVCIVYSDQLNIGVLMHTRDDDGAERWVLDKVSPLDKELERVIRGGLYDDSVVENPSELFVLAVRDGYVYLAASWRHNGPRLPCWFLSLCLETMKLERLFRRALSSSVHPYIMVWPPSLVGNHGRFENEDAP